MTEYPPPPPGNYPPPPPPGNYPPPPPGQGGYGGPGGYGGAPAKTNSLAIGSLIASCVGLLCGIGSIIGIVLGIIAMNQIKKTGETGHGLALAGVIVGAVSLAISLIWNIYVFS